MSAKYPEFIVSSRKINGFLAFECRESGETGCYGKLGCFYAREGGNLWVAFLPTHHSNEKRFIGLSKLQSPSKSACFENFDKDKEYIFHIPDKYVVEVARLCDIKKSRPSQYKWARKWHLGINSEGTEGR